MTAGLYLKNMKELTEAEMKDIFVGLDTQFNEVMINASTHGIYTGIVVITLWTIASRDNYQNYRRPRVFAFIILVLYVLATFNFYCGWAQNVSYFSTAGECFWEAYKSKHNQDAPVLLGIDAILSTILVDATLIWRCWIVWGRTCRVVIVPIACTTLAIVSRGIITYYSPYGSVENTSPRALYNENLVNWAVLYSSLILATLLWCTIFIVHRILRVDGISAGMHVYHRLVEMLVESASLYSSVIVVLLVFEVRNEAVGAYIEEFAIAMRGIMPTILVGRIAAGHARPDDSWSESTTTSSLQFRSSLSSQSDSVDTGVGSESGLSPLGELGLKDAYN
ncbi:hypothetical protein F5146DRAFT_1176520 [Armillaria mellea]|nr:hypothetical protein F5146DRAFT_1176520 [Armillaria mellea]